MARPPINERLALHEELLERLVANQTNLVDLYRSQESNGVLFSGTVVFTALGSGPDGWRTVLDFPVPYAGFRACNHTGNYSVVVTNWAWSDASSMPALSGEIWATPGPTAGLIQVPQTQSQSAYHLAGATMQLAIPELGQTPNGQTLMTLTVYSDPRMVL
jgi:hypothetical protein